jgi:CHAT domain-containing protein
VVKPTGEVAFRLVDLTATDAPFHTLVKLSRQSIGARGRGSAPELPQLAQQPEQVNLRLHQLYQILVEPIADLLPTDSSEHTVFIPQNELFLVPFPALVNANGQSLIEHHIILTAPSIQVLGLTHQLAKQQSTSTSTADATVATNNTCIA